MLLTPVFIVSSCHTRVILEVGHCMIMIATSFLERREGENKEDGKGAWVVSRGLGGERRGVGLEVVAPRDASCSLVGCWEFVPTG